MSEKIGIYAGAFDPVHNGHIAFAVATAAVCGLDKIIFLPERQPRGKNSAVDFAHRVAMLQIATGSHTRFEVCELDTPQFSVKHTLPELQALYPGERLTLLVGSDNVRSMNPTTWPDVHHLYETTDIAIGMRKDDDAHGLQHVAGKANVFYVYTDFPHASSTEVRAGQRQLIADEVAEYIDKHRLYKA
jgi:nicotinate-nucleotide adenylyltransferase